MDDLISRKAAIDALVDYIHNIDKVYSTGKLSADDCKDAAHSVLDDLPSAQPQRMRGKWVDMAGDGKLFRCSRCDEIVCWAQHNYCPNCGSYNGGEQESEIHSDI